MVDESRGLEPDSDEADDEIEAKNRRSLSSVVVTLIVIIGIVLVFLLLRSGDRGKPDGATTSDGQSITAVKGLKPEPGIISVWVTQGTSIDELLLNAQISASDVVSMNGGRFVVGVAEGTEDEAMRALAKVAGVVDTGRVYGDGESGK